MKNQKGFTLIELLTVISIISFLASLLLVGLHQASLKSVDAKVKADLGEFASAVNLYYQDNGDIPTQGLNPVSNYYECFWDINCGKWPSGYLSGYLSSLPQTKLSGNNMYYGYIAIPKSTIAYTGCAYGVVMANCVCIGPGGMLIYVMTLNPKDAVDPKNSNWWDLPSDSNYGTYSILAGNAYVGDCPASASNFFY